MVPLNDEASPISRLIGFDGKSTIGWVYIWEDSELAILWIAPEESAAFIDPAIGADLLAKASATTPVDVISFLGTLIKPTVERGSW